MSATFRHEPYDLHESRHNVVAHEHRPPSDVGMSSQHDQRILGFLIPPEIRRSRMAGRHRNHGQATPNSQEIFRSEEEVETGLNLFNRAWPISGGGRFFLFCKINESTMSPQLTHCQATVHSFPVSWRGSNKLTVHINPLQRRQFMICLVSGSPLKKGRDRVTVFGKPSWFLPFVGFASRSPALTAG